MKRCPISWKFQKQTAVTLTSSETKFVAILEKCAEIIFLRQMMEFLNITVMLPITVRVDNVRAIFLAYYARSEPQTKHVNIRYHFVRDYIKAGTIQIDYVKSEDNDRDTFTKNLSEELYNKHCKKHMHKSYNKKTQVTFEQILMS